jgi:hypothetical protein
MSDLLNINQTKADFTQNLQIGQLIIWITDFLIRKMSSKKSKFSGLFRNCGT